jgi:hypothetical protein
MTKGQNDKSPMLQNCSFGLCEEKPGSGFGLGLQHLATTVEAGRADVVTQMGFTGRRFNRNARHVRALCERCIPRLEGDFLFCWTAMIRSWARVLRNPQHRGLVNSAAISDAKPQIIA